MIRLFHGKNSHLTHLRSTKEFKDLIIKYPNFEQCVLDGDSDDPLKIADTYKTVGMFSEGKIILIRRFSKSKMFKELFEDIKLIETNNIEILLVEDDKVASNTRYYKYFDSIKGIIESQELNKKTFTNWIKQVVKDYELRISDSFIPDFAQLLNFDTSKAINELEKYKLAGITEINSTSIEKFTINSFENSIWEFIDSLNIEKFDTSRTLTILENIFKLGIEPIFVISMIARNLRQIVLVKEQLKLNTDNKTICSKLKIPPFNLSSIKTIAMKYSDKNLSDLYEKLTNLDFESKLGNIDPKTGLTLLVVLFDRYLTR